MIDSYEIFKQDIFKLTKIDLNAYKERQMKRRIDALIAKHNVPTYKDYINLLVSDKVRFEEFVNYLTINVSEFYRNPNQWEVLEKEVLPRIFNQSGKKIKIWSAACSTGDEPYTLVMLLAKYMPLTDIKVFATDIDKQVLEKAKMGLYNPKSLQGLPKEYIQKYFDQINDNAFEIKSEIKNRVEFKQHNLLLDAYPKDVDLIVCRNVLIYFTEEAKNDIYKKFHEALKKDGILFVGSTEQIIQPQTLGFSSFRSFFYEKHEI